MTLQGALPALEQAGMDELYCPVRDGRFASGFTLGQDWIHAVAQAASVPSYVHLLAKDADRYTALFDPGKVHGLIVPVEGCVHIHRALTAIRDAGFSPGLSINPGTSLGAVDYLLEYIDRLVVFSTEPGYDTPVSSTAERIEILAENIRHRRLKIALVATGVYEPQDGARYAAAGANGIVIEQSDGLRQSDPGDWLRRFTRAVESKRRVI